ncbi:hypothetical protein GIX81_03615 [Lactobacillus reuteri]|uniref:Uncharacterized protein n=1 Tax=Limosilactobacillus reuteri TaxID=1598 RepID=A0A6L5P2L6_LIMRT|nr:hypothetical protein [Limosilactobacillus reuteri]MRH08548.1 hypothetical protein [Limosilactobacillus reuteri]
MKEEITVNKGTFANHIASYHRWGNLERLIWKDRRYELRNRIIYIFDRIDSTLYISGDFGCGVLSWFTSTNTLQDVADYSKSVGYFASKIQTAERKYKYDYQLASEELDEFLCLDEDDEDFAILIDDRKKLKDDLLACFYSGEGYDLDDDLKDRLSDWDPDWWEDLPEGRRISDDVQLWAFGLQQAMKQVRERKSITSINAVDDSGRGRKE